jgi:hypothetical protein
MTAQDPSPGSTLSREQALLVEFLDNRDVPCPVCGYSLRALTFPVCPECRHELSLTVGTAHPRFGWLLAAVAPGFFSGIAAGFLLIPIVLRLVFAGGYSPTMIAVDLFGWCSGIVAVLLATRRVRFIRQSRSAQRLWTLAIWAVHVAALGLLILIGPRYI